MSRSRRHWLGLVLAIAVGVALGSVVFKKSPPPEPVAIEDGQTIDFSSGQPGVTGDAASRAALEKANQELDEAAANITL